MLSLNTIVCHIQGVIVLYCQQNMKQPSQELPVGAFHLLERTRRREAVGSYIMVITIARFFGQDSENLNDAVH